MTPSLDRTLGAVGRTLGARGRSFWAVGRALPLVLLGISCGARTTMVPDGGEPECGIPPSGPTAHGITQLALGPAHSCALVGDGTVRCWGDNHFGALGDGSRTNSAVPVTVLGLGRAVQIACGGEPGCAEPGASPLCAGGQTCAVLEGGTVSCWGDVDGTAEPSASFPEPTAVDGLTDVVEVAIGRREHCALRSDGTVQCWDGRQPLRSIEGVADAVQIAVGGGHACALLADGTVTCWGAFDYDLGNGTNDQHGPDLPPTVVAGLEGVIALATREKHVCASRADGRRVCWGTNARGELGPAPEPPLTAVRPVVEPRLACGAELALGPIHTCQRLVNGHVACWGDGLHGKLGRTLPPDEDDLLRDYLRSPTPVEVEGLSFVRDLALGGEHGCATTETDLLCWGRNHVGQLGDGTTESRTAPTRVRW